MSSSSPFTYSLIFPYFLWFWRCFSARFRWLRSVAVAFLFPSHCIYPHSIISFAVLSFSLFFSLHSTHLVTIHIHVALLPLSLLHCRLLFFSYLVKLLLLTRHGLCYLRRLHLPWAPLQSALPRSLSPTFHISIGINKRMFSFTPVLSPPCHSTAWFVRFILPFFALRRIQFSHHPHKTSFDFRITLYTIFYFFSYVHTKREGLRMFRPITHITIQHVHAPHMHGFSISQYFIRLQFSFAWLLRTLFFGRRIFWDDLFKWTTFVFIALRSNCTSLALVSANCFCTSSIILVVVVVYSTFVDYLYLKKRQLMLYFIVCISRPSTPYRNQEFQFEPTARSDPT
jgi:hypothetical protein